jgi:hypothetical protein
VLFAAKMQADLDTATPGIGAETNFLKTGSINDTFVVPEKEGENTCYH